MSFTVVPLHLVDVPPGTRIPFGPDFVFEEAKNCYATRSKIVHGRWKHDPKITDAMADTEALVRTAFRKLLADPQMLKVFISKKRDAFLEDWVFSRSTDTPPFPE